MAALNDIAGFLDRELCVDAFEDDSHNGLQVANDREIKTICCGVDASMQFFEAARQREADLLVCHHGISWGDSLKRITDVNYARIAFLVRSHMALYACHLPLDAHKDHGNNALLCREMDLRKLERFGLYHGMEIGFCGMLPQPMPYARLKERIAALTRSALTTMDFGPETVRSVGVVSGGAAEEVAEAGRKGIDVYLSGEPNLVAYNLAREYGVNAVFAGHYATEVFGVRALADLLRRSFDVETEFIDLEIPY